MLSRQVLRGYASRPVETLERALALAQKAVSIDPESPQAQWSLGYIYMQQKKYSHAVKALEYAISLSPSYADGYGLLALIRNNQGQAEEAIKLINKGMKLNPYYSWDYLYNLGRAHYALGKFSTAIPYLEQALERNPAATHPTLYLIASYVQLDRAEDAEWLVTDVEVQNPEISISHLQKVLAIGDEDLRGRLFKDLKAAGMAE